MKRLIKSSQYILAMSVEKSKLEKRMEAWSDLIAEHLSKCAVKLCSAKDRPSSGCNLDVASQD